MKANEPWSWRFTALKTTKVMLVRLPLTNVKVMSELTVMFLHVASSLYLKALSHCLWPDVCPPPTPVAGIWNKANFPPAWLVYWLLSDRQPDPHFLVTVSRVSAHEGKRIWCPTSNRESKFTISSPSFALLWLSRNWIMPVAIVVVLPLGRSIFFNFSADSNANLFQKRSHRHT